MQQTFKDTGPATPPIDRRSFILGMITAFAECLANEAKKLALSPPFYPEDYSAVLPEAERIAQEQGIFLWFEKNEDIAERFRVQWFVMYKFPEVLAEYKHLRSRGYNPAREFVKFFDLLSYGTVWGDGADGVIPGMREKRKTVDTVSRVLLGAGGWPPPKDWGDAAG